jgi:hypothetical protein
MIDSEADLVLDTTELSTADLAAEMTPSPPSPVERSVGGAIGLTLALPILIGGSAALVAGSRLFTSGGVASGSRPATINPDQEDAIGSTGIERAGDATAEAEQTPLAAEAAPVVESAGEADTVPGDANVAGGEGIVGPSVEGETVPEDSLVLVETADGAAAPDQTPTEPGGGPGGRDRTRERGRRRERSTEGGAAPQIPDGAEQSAGLGPIVRHMSLLTKELGEAQRMVGRLAAERDVLQRQIGELQGVPIVFPPTATEAAKPAREGNRQEREAAKANRHDRDSGQSNREARMEARAEARAARHGGHAEGDEEAPDETELSARAKRSGQRRRLMALGVILLLVIIGAIWRQLDLPVPSLPKGTGPFQLLFMVLLLGRVARFSGRGVKWLYPSPEKNRRRR